MNSKLKNDALDRFFEAVLALESVDECYDFFDDLCTVQELKALSQRMRVAKMLHEGKQYSEIAEKTGSSTATISRVNRSLNFGCDGYRMILGRLGKL